MNFNNLEYFVSVVEEQSFSKAAKKHFVTQVAVTQQIATIEKELGVPLFNREEKQIRVTQAGNFFYEEAKKILTHYYFTMNQIQNYHTLKKAQINIGIAFMKDYEWVSYVVGEFLKKHPEANIVISYGNCDDLISKVKKGLLEAALVYEVVDKKDYSLDMKLVYQEKISVIMPLSNSLSSKETLAVEDIEDFPLIYVEDSHYKKYHYQELTSYCLQKGFAPQLIDATVDVDNAMIMVDMKEYIAVIPEDRKNWHGSKKRKYMEFNQPIHALSKAFVWNRETPNDVVLMLMEYVEKELQNGEIKKRIW